MVFVAGQLDDQRVLVCSAGRVSHDSGARHAQLTFEKGIHADGTSIRGRQRLVGHALQLVQEAVGHALQLGGRVIRIPAQHLYHVGQQIVVAAAAANAAAASAASVSAAVVRRSSAHHLEGVGQQAEGGGHVLGLGHGVGIVVGVRVRGVDELELGEEGGEVRPAGRVLGRVRVRGEVVFDCVRSMAAACQLHGGTLTLVARHGSCAASWGCAGDDPSEAWPAQRQLSVAVCTLSAYMIM